MVASGQSGCISAKFVLFVYIASRWSELVVFEQMGFYRAKWLYSGKVVVLGQRWLYSGKVVVFWQKWLYSGKSGCIRAKVVVFRQKWF